MATLTTGFVPKVVGSIVRSSKAQSHGNVVRLLVGSGPVERDCCAYGSSYCHTHWSRDVDIPGSSCRPGR